jgi:hypothetical protein
LESFWPKISCCRNLVLTGAYILWHVVREGTGGRLFLFRTHSVDCSFARSLNDFKIFAFTKALVRRRFQGGGIGFRGRITESGGLLNECYQPSVQKAFPANWIYTLNLRFLMLSSNCLACFLACKSACGPSQCHTALQYLDLEISFIYYFIRRRTFLNTL